MVGEAPVGFTIDFDRLLSQTFQKLGAGDAETAVAAIHNELDGTVDLYDLAYFFKIIFLNVLLIGLPGPRFKVLVVDQLLEFLNFFSV